MAFTTIFTSSVHLAGKFQIKGLAAVLGLLLEVDNNQYYQLFVEMHQVVETYLGERSRR